MDCDIIETIDDIFNKIIILDYNLLKPFCVDITFEEIQDIKELFEFLLQFITKLFKYFNSDNNGIVNLSLLTLTDFDKINKYLSCIGFKSSFNKLPATNENIDFVNNNKYTNIKFTQTTQLKELMFGLKCDNNIYIITFDYLQH